MCWRRSWIDPWAERRGDQPSGPADRHKVPSPSPLPLPSPSPSPHPLPSPSPSPHPLPLPFPSQLVAEVRTPMALPCGTKVTTSPACESSESEYTVRGIGQGSTRSCSDSAAAPKKVYFATGTKKRPTEIGINGRANARGDL